MLLDVDTVDVPVFADLGLHWWRATLQWLRPRGFSLVQFPESETFVPSPGAAYIVMGVSPRGVPHSIVRTHRADCAPVDYDPHPSGEGLDSIDHFVMLVPCGDL